MGRISRGCRALKKCSKFSKETSSGGTSYLKQHPKGPSKFSKCSVHGKVMQPRPCHCRLALFESLWIDETTLKSAAEFQTQWGGSSKGASAIS